MRGLIKSGDMVGTRHVRTLALEAALNDPSLLRNAEIELARLRGEVETLSQDLEIKSLQIEQLKADAPRATAEAEVRGLTRGRSEGEARREESLARLEAGLEQARAAFQGEMMSLERLAILVARECLGKMIGDPGERGLLLAEAIRHQVEQIQAQGLIAIEVSAAEFSDPEELERLAEKIGQPKARLEAVNDLQAGDCRMILSLGGLEIGLNQQWSRLDAALIELAKPGSLG